MSQQICQLVLALVCLCVQKWQFKMSGQSLGEKTHLKTGYFSRLVVGKQWQI